MRILLEVEELPFVEVGTLEADQFVPSRHDAVVGPDVVRHWKLEVLVIEALPPVGRSLSSQERNEASPLHLAGYRQAGRFQKRLREIDVRDDALARASGFDHPRPANDQGSAQRFLEDPALVEPAVLSQIKSLIRCVDDDRVAGQTGLVEEVEQRPTLSSTAFTHPR